MWMECLVVLCFFVVNTRRIWVGKQYKSYIPRISAQGYIYLITSLISDHVPPQTTWDWNVVMWQYQYFSVLQGEIWNKSEIFIASSVQFINKLITVKFNQDLTENNNDFTFHIAYEIYKIYTVFLFPELIDSRLGILMHISTGCPHPARAHREDITKVMKNI